MLVAACGGSGGGDGTDESASREPAWVTILTRGPAAIYGARDDGGKNPVELSAGLDFSPASPFGYVSPDGRQIAMRAMAASDSVRQNYLRDTDGSNLRKISQLANPAAVVLPAVWAPDSSALVYTADGDTADVFELYRVDRDGANHEKLNDPLNVNETLFGPIWSPDSRYIAFQIRTIGGSFGKALGIYDTRTGTQARVAVPQTIVPESVRWSPTSEKLAYLRYDNDSTGNKWEVYTLNADGSDHDGPFNGSLGSELYLADYKWSPNGRYLAQLFRRRAASLSGEHAIRFLNIYDLEASNPASASKRVHDFRLYSTTNSNDCRDYCGFEWSQAGTELIFLSDADTGSFIEPWSYNVAGGTSRELNHGLPDPVNYDVSRILGTTADDRYLLYQGGYPSNTTVLKELIDFSAPGDPAIRIAGLGDLIRVTTWGPDHRRIFFARQNTAENFIETRREKSFETGSNILEPRLPAELVINDIELSEDSEVAAFLVLDTIAGGYPGSIYSVPTSGGEAKKISRSLDVERMLGY
jgi:Tol biopolymer transport system component